MPVAASLVAATTLELEDSANQLEDSTNQVSYSWTHCQNLFCKFR